MENKGAKTGTASKVGVTVKKSDRTELKCLANPPQGVKNTLIAALYLLGKPITPGREWTDVQKFLAAPTSEAEMNDLDVSKVEPEAVVKAKEVLSGLTADEIRNKCCAASEMFRWVQAVIAAVECQAGGAQP